MTFADHSPSYILNSDSSPENIGIYTQYIEDKDGTLFLEDVMAAGDENTHKDSTLQWQQAPFDGLAKGFTDSVYWLRFSVHNTGQDINRWYLEFRYPILDSIEYYTPNKHGDYSKQLAGDAYPFDQRTIDYRNIVFLQNTPAQTVQTFYLRVDTSSSMFVPLHIWPHDTFFHEIDNVKLLLGILYGIVILALLISAVNAIFLKDIMYIWLSGIFICFFLYLGGIKGVAFQALWPNSLYWQEISIPFFMNMSYTFGFLYCRAYINLKELSTTIDVIIKYLAIIGVISALLCFVVEYRYIISYSTIMTMLTQIICLSIGSYSWYKGNTAARLFVLSWTALFLGAVSFALIALGLIPKTFLTEWFQELGFGAMVTLMIIAQFDRFLQIQKSHERNQVASLDAVKNAEKKYRSLFENAIEGIFQLNEKGVLINVNNAFAKILGLDDPIALVETRDTPFTLGFMSETEGNKLEAMLNTKGALNEYKVSFASPTGEIRWASISLQKVKSSTDMLFHFEGSLTDITETKKREQAEKQRRMAEASTEAKSMFLANMSHEIRTPMNAITGFTDLAIKANQDKNLSDFLRKIKTASSNLLGIINDILDFSKIEAGKLKIESIPFNIRELISNIYDIVEASTSTKGLNFSINIDDDIPETIIGDSLRLHQIILNLTNNAVKFTSEGSVKVELDLLALDKKKGTIKLVGRVIDTGIGISQEKQNKLFTSFSQADESTTRTFGGTGLGLSISKQLIAMMGGDIKVRSIENQGSVFEFNFQCRLESRKRQSHHQNKKLNVLIVDDNQDSRLLIESVVDDLKHTSSSASSADEALQLLKTSNDKGVAYDLLLIDWLMPGTDGFECLKRIQESKDISTPKSILVTTYGEEGLEEKALNIGFNGYIEKPMKKDHLQQLISELFVGHQTIKQGSIPSKVDSRRKQNNIASPQALTPAQTIDSDVEESSFNNIHALLVEDVAMNQELAMEILRRRGIRTTIANNGEQGLELAKSASFDLILMDMQMPIMDGCEASTLIREFDQKTPIIAMTANAMSEDKKRCLDAGMNDFVTKPIDDKALFSTIEKHLPHAIIEVTKENKQAAEPDTRDDIDTSAETVGTDTDSQTPLHTNTAQDDQLEAKSGSASVPEAKSSEPIDNRTSAPSPSMPEELPSIDLKDGLERCQGNQKLYLKLLGDFIRNYGDASSEMQAFMKQGDLVSIGKLAHTFKGLSANLGAKSLSSYAMKLEHISDMPESDQQESLQEFASLLATLVTELTALLEQMNENTNDEITQHEAYSLSEIAQHIEALQAMIHEQKMDAYDRAIEVAARCPEKEAKPIFDALVEQLDLFDFEAAKESIEAIKVMLTKH